VDVARSAITGLVTEEGEESAKREKELAAKTKR
jgi:hypothetical protein